MLVGLERALNVHLTEICLGVCLLALEPRYLQSAAVIISRLGSFGRTCSKYKMAKRF